MAAPNKPVRSIGVQSRSMTGTRPDGNRYESALERDFMILVEDHPEYASYLAQPVFVKYKHPKTGRVTDYPPDGLVRWTTNRPPLLVEIKYREDCAGKWREFRAKFRAAKVLCAQNGWQFEVVTEEDIRSDRLFNVNFLSGYKTRQPDQQLSKAIIHLLLLHPQTIREITSHTSLAGFPSGAIVSCCWTLAASRKISLDMDVKVNVNTKLWVDK